MSEIVFTVEPEEDGGYSASASEQSIFTQGDDWADLLANLREVLALYAEVTGERPEVVTLKVRGLIPQAA